MGGHIFPDINRPFPSCPKPLFHNEAKCEAIDMKTIFFLMQVTVADPDLQIRWGGGGGGGHPDPEIRGGWSQNKIFSALQASFWPKNKEGALPSIHQ